MKKYLMAALAVSLASPAFAHLGHGTNGLDAGLAHPLMGGDHLSAMLAVGIWSGIAMPRHLWSGAIAFLSAMTAGAGLAWAGIGLPMVETGILLSVLAFGALVLMARADQTAIMKGGSLAVIAGFAALHGHAHASEATGAALAYLGGFLVSTTFLHLAGIMIARMVAGQPLAQKLLGGTVIASGFALMFG